MGSCIVTSTYVFSEETKKEMKDDDDVTFLQGFLVKQFLVSFSQYPIKKQIRKYCVVYVRDEHLYVVFQNIQLQQCEHAQEKQTPSPLHCSAGQEQPLGSYFLSSPKQEEARNTKQQNGHGIQQQDDDTSSFRIFAANQQSTYQQAMMIAQSSHQPYYCDTLVMFSK